MADQIEIERIAREVVNANTASGGIISLQVRDDVDWMGDPIIRISVVLADEAMNAFDGEASIRVLSQVNDRLEATGDSRFPMIDYATPSELAEENAAS